MPADPTSAITRDSHGEASGSDKAGFGARKGAFAGDSRGAPPISPPATRSRSRRWWWADRDKSGQWLLAVEIPAPGLDRSFHLRWKQVPDPTHHSRKWAFSLLDTGFRHGPRGPTHESNHKADRFANVRVLATWTLFESEFWPNRFKRLGIRPIQSENFSLVLPFQAPALIS